jgi:hypothetical protein
MDIQNHSKLLSGFPWSINGNPDNNLESSCRKKMDVGCTYLAQYTGQLQVIMITEMNYRVS